MRCLVARSVVLAFTCFSSHSIVAGPATRPADLEVDKLIFQLGDADPSVRESAALKLREIGKPALPALKEAATSPDIEISATAAALVKRIERRLPLPNPALAGRTVSRTTIRNGQRTVNVTADGLEISIIQSADAIDMSVTGLENGKPATVNFKAKTPDELKANEPEAYAIWDRWVGARGRAVIQGRAIAPAAVQIAPQIEQIRAEKVKVEGDAPAKAEDARRRAEELLQQIKERRAAQLHQRDLDAKQAEIMKRQADQKDRAAAEEKRRAEQTAK